MPSTPERIPFVEFVRRKEMREPMAKAFETALRDEGPAAFNYRTESEWERALAQFHQADRRRRS
jgi:hypothetical protein